MSEQGKLKPDVEQVKILGQEPAFPTGNTLHYRGNIYSPKIEDGMSKRFYAACAAMKGFVSNSDWAKASNIADDFDEYKKRVISASYEFADELLKQENL